MAPVTVEAGASAVIGDVNVHVNVPEGDLNALNEALSHSGLAEVEVLALLAAAAADLDAGVDQGLLVQQYIVGGHV